MKAVLRVSRFANKQALTVLKAREFCSLSQALQPPSHLRAFFSEELERVKQRKKVILKLIIPV